MSNAIPIFIELRNHYQNLVEQSEHQAAEAKAQLAHVEALLLNDLLQAHSSPTLETKAKLRTKIPHQKPDQSHEAIAFPLLPAPVEAPAPSQAPTPKVSIRKAKAAPAPSAQGKRSPRPLLPAYQGLTRLEAIAQRLQATPGQEVTIDTLIHGLFGDLSAAEHKSERLNLKTLMYQGEKRELWQKGSVPTSYLIKGSTGRGRGSKKAAPATEAPEPTSKPTIKARAKAKAPKPPSAKAKQRISLTVLPAYAKLTKREAIAQVLGQHPGEVLHHDTIIQTLYGDLSPETLKEERVRIKTALLTGVKDGKWQKASVPSSYFLNGQPPVSTDRKTGAKASAKPLKT